MSEIRECVLFDLDAIASLQALWKNEDITYGFEPGTQEYLAGKLGDYFYVAHAGRDIIGFAYGTIKEAVDMCIFPDGTKYLEIDDIYVRPDHRNAGVGGALLDKLLQVAHEHSVDNSHLYSSDKDMEKILSFYKKHGYKTWNVQMFK